MATKKKAAKKAAKKLLLRKLLKKPLLKKLLKKLLRKLLKRNKFSLVSFAKDNSSGLYRNFFFLLLIPYNPLQ